MTHRVKVKLDGNHHAIVDAILAAGYRVQTLSQGMGVPDLLIADGRTGRMWLVEVKMPGEPLTDYQRKWASLWPIPVIVAHTPEEALAGVR